MKSSANGSAGRMWIGELAERTGLSRHTIRFYERRGVLPEPERTPSGYRTYGPDAVERLAFIAKAKALGLRLEEIREVFEISSGGRAPCAQVRAAIEARLDEVEARLAELASLRATLRRALAELARRPPVEEGCRCPVIERSGPARATAGRRTGPRRGERTREGERSSRYAPDSTSRRRHRK